MTAWKSVRLAAIPLAILFSTAAFDGDFGCSSPDSGDPLRTDRFVSADELSIEVTLNYVSRPQRDLVTTVIYVGAFTQRSMTYREPIVLKDSRFYIDELELELLPDTKPTLYESLSGKTLTYVDVDGQDHKIVLPELPGSTIVDQIPATIQSTEPLVVFWDGLPLGDSDSVGINISSERGGSITATAREPGERAVLFRPFELEGITAGEVSFSFDRETITTDYPGTNGGWVRATQADLDVVTSTLE